MKTADPQVTFEITRRSLGAPAAVVYAHLKDQAFAWRSGPLASPLQMAPSIAQALGLPLTMVEKALNDLMASGWLRWPAAPKAASHLVSA